MEKLCKPELCTGCGACASACPKGCITMEADAEGFLQPHVDAETCINCGKCTKICPILSQSGQIAGNTVAYAAVHNDAQVRNSSTSGGVFSLLCDWVLAENGIVFGAAYDDDFMVAHGAVEDAGELPGLRGAKYAQSRLGNTYAQVRDQLEKGRYVLFSGTPCQVGGLRSYLGKEYENLVLVDLICHGVPSPAVWRHYIEHRSRKDAAGQRPVAVNLRSKETGWAGYSVRFDYADGRKYAARNSQDPYIRGFVQNLYLRPSCYQCHFKGAERASDFTLGDYWGVWDQLPECHDDKGTSLILVHTEKAHRILEAMSCKMQYRQVDLSKALEGNPSALVSSSHTEKREDFLKRYQEEDFDRLVDRLCPKPAPQKTSLVRRVVRKLKRVLHI